MKWTGTWSYCIGSLIKHRPLGEHSSHFFTPVLSAFRKSSAVLHGHLYIFHLQIWSSSNDVNTHTVSSASCYGFWITKKLMSSWQHLLSTEAKGQSAEQTMKHRAEIPEAPTHIHWHTRASQVARPDFTELDVFLGQHILLTLGQHFNSKI